MNINQKAVEFANKDLLLPFLALLMSTVILSFSAILMRRVEFDLGPGATLFNRYWIAVVAFSLWESSKLILRRESDQGHKLSKRFTTNDLMIFATESLLSFGCVLLWAISLTRTSVANANLLHNMTPIFSTLGGWLILNQQFDNRFLIGLSVTLLAASCIEFEDWFTTPSNVTGDMLALLSSVFYAGSFLARESLRNKYSASAILLWSCITKATLALGLALTTEDGLFPVTQSTWLSAIALGIVVQVFGHSLLTYSLRHFSSGFATVCLLLDPLITALLAWVFFAEQLTPLNIISLIGVLVGIYITSLGKGVEKPMRVQEQ